MELTLRQARKMKEISQRTVANRLNVCEETYRKIERNPDLATIGQAKVLSDLLDISYDVIFFDGNSSLTGGNGKAS